MDPNDAVQSGAFSEEEKLPEGIDEDANWFGKTLGDESDSTVEHEVLNTQISQDEGSIELGKDSDLGEDKGTKSTEEMMESDSQSELLDEITEDSVEKHQVTLGSKKNELTELKDIAIDGKKHDISNELKEMFEEKSSDAEEMHESSLTKHSLDTEITKEDKLKDIVPDDILGKDDSFDELDNDALHQELEAHLSYEKSKELMTNLPVTDSDLQDEVPVPQVEEGVLEESQTELQSEPEMNKSLEDLNFEEKSSDLLKNLAENMGTKEIDEIIEHSMPSEEDSSSKEMNADLKEISSDLGDVSELKDDLENQLQNITGEVDDSVKPEEENVTPEEIVNQVDKSSIELNQENMMVEFAHDNSNQVLIQINTDQTEPPIQESTKTEQLVMETSDGQTLVFSTETVDGTGSSEESDIVSQVEGGAEFLQAVTGKLEDVLMPTKDDTPKEEASHPTQPVAPIVQTPPAPVAEKKEIVQDEGPRCCITTCKSGKSTLKTTFRYFKPPTNKILYKKWEYIFNQARQQMSPTSLICELHFRTGLIYKRGIDKTGKVLWALREGALPKLSPSGILRVTGGVIPPPSTTVQVTKKPEGVGKTPLVKPTSSMTEKKITSTSELNLSSSPKKVFAKKILQKPIKTVATKVSNEVTDIGFLYKNPQLVRAAQEEIAQVDVMVCGECHSVFHILELFQAHKMAQNCKGESNFKGNPSEPKPQVWAFLLWKSAQAKVSDAESSWRLYQRWCKMDERVRSAWIAAGRSLQESNSIASLKLFDSPTPRHNKVGRPPTRDSEDEDFIVRKQKRSKPTSKDDYADLGGAGDGAFSEPEPMEVENAHVSPAKPSEDAREVDETLDELSRHTPEMITSEVEIKQEVMSDDEHGENKENDRQNKESDEIQNCTRCKRPISNLKSGILCAAGCYGYFHVECTRVNNIKNLSKLGVKKLTWKCDACKFKDMGRPTEKVKPQVVHSVNQQEKPKNQEKEEEEFVVEKIVSRRYNIKKKHFEYLLKWEGYPSDQNTWEPAENLGTCQHLLKAFEEALAKQQAAKQAAGGKPAPVIKQDAGVKPPVIPKKKPLPSTPGPSTPSLNSGRPVRSSKQKAMDQVKAWCGTIVKPDADVGIKRKQSSDSEYEEEVVVKRVKVEVDSEDSDEDSVKRVERFTPSRGRGRPPLSANTARVSAQNVSGFLNKPVVNGEQKESNLAAALGLESDEDEEESKPKENSLSPQKSPVVRKMSSLSPQNQQVLVASAKGVVTVDHKTVPNLSSGVYIMSNKSGIVKVDNDKSMNTLQKSGVLKRPIPKSPNAESPKVATHKVGSGVVVLPRSEASGQQKVGIMRKSAVAPTPPANTTLARPSGLLKPLRPGVTPRPLGLLKTPDASNPPPLTPHRVVGGTPGKIQHIVRPRNATPLRGRPTASPLVRRVSYGSGLQATPQQRMLIAKKKAESENVEVGASGKPTVSISPAKKILVGPSGEETRIAFVKPKPDVSTPTLPPIKSTNKVFAHPMLRGRGRGVFRGRGRGSSLGHLLQMSQREVVPEAVRDSKLVDSDNLLMEFQEPSDSEESDDGVDDAFNLADLPPIEPDSPPRPLTLDPETGKVLCKAEGEKTPEPTPPPSPKAPTPPPQEVKTEEPTHILPDHEDQVETEPEHHPVPVAVRAVSPRAAPTPATPSSISSAALKQQDRMICKVEMSPGGTTGTLVEAVNAATATPPGVTEGTVTIKKPSSRNRLSRGPQLSVMPSNSSNTSMGTITVPARKLFQEENGDDDMVTITGEDGLVYQVSNSELAGNTLLVSSGEDGQQQCVYVTTDGDGTEEGSTILTLDTAYADAVAQLGTDQVNILSTEGGQEFYIKEGDGEEGQLMTLEGDEGVVGGDDQGGQVVAQLVEAGEPAPGGSRRVVLLLPDGNLMMTEVDEEQYAALDLDK